MILSDVNGNLSGLDTTVLNVQEAGAAIGGHGADVIVGEHRFIPGSAVIMLIPVDGDSSRSIALLKDGSRLLVEEDVRAFLADEEEPEAEPCCACGGASDFECAHCGVFFCGTCADKFIGCPECGEDR